MTEPKNINFDQVADDIDGVADKGDLQELSSLALAVGSVMNKHKGENTTKVCLTQYLTLIVSYFAHFFFPMVYTKMETNWSRCHNNWYWLAIFLIFHSTKYFKIRTISALFIFCLDMECGMW